MARDKCDEGRTHWEGCWRVHHDCAIAKIAAREPAAAADFVKEWFDGVRLSTEEQEDLLRTAIERKCQHIATGDTVIDIEDDYATVMRVDFHTRVA